MRRVTCYRTLGGLDHPTFEAALKHAEKRYADALLRLARTLANMNYTFTSDFIDANLEEFVQLKALKADCTLSNPADDDDGEDGA